MMWQTVTDALITMPLMLLAALMVLLAGATWLMARMLLRPARMSDAKAAYVLQRLSPADLGLRYEPVTFPVRDHRTGKVLPIAGWWIPCPAATTVGARAGENGSPAPAARAHAGTLAGVGERTAVLLHGYGDAKVGAIAWAPMWLAMGYHVLAIDLRAHGETGGAYSTGGYHERHDVNQVLDQLTAARPNQTRTLVLFGVSLGAAVALAAMAIRETPQDVQALVLECPYAHYTGAVLTHARHMNMPARFLHPLGIRLAQWISGARFDEVAPLRTIAQAPCPVMLIQGGCDVLVSPVAAEAVAAAVNRRDDGRSIVWRVPSAGHVTSICADPEEYRRQIERFLASAIADAKPAEAPSPAPRAAPHLGARPDPVSR